MSNIEKIKAEIERRKKGNMYDELPTTIGRYYEDRDLLTFIDTLPEEMPSGECIKEEADNYLYGDDVKPYYYDSDFGKNFYISDDIRDAFIAGAEWQKEQMMKEWLQDRDGCFWDGVNEGKKAMRDQMIEDAGDGEIVKDISNMLAVTAKGINLDGFKFGDKVKIIIVKQ